MTDGTGNQESDAEKSVARRIRQFESDTRPLTAAPPDLPTRREQARRWVMLVVISVWGLVVLGIATVALIEARFDFDKGIPIVLELLKIGIMPVVTFGLGYYFAKEKE